MLNTQRSWIEALKDLVRATYRPVDGVRLLLEPDLPDRSHRGAALPHHRDHSDSQRDCPHGRGLALSHCHSHDKHDPLLPESVYPRDLWKL